MILCGWLRIAFFLISLKFPIKNFHDLKILVVVVCHLLCDKMFTYFDVYILPFTDGSHV